MVGVGVGGSYSIGDVSVQVPRPLSLQQHTRRPATANMTGEKCCANYYYYYYYCCYCYYYYYYYYYYCFCYYYYYFFF